MQEEILGFQRMRFIITKIISYRKILNKFKSYYCSHCYFSSSNK